MSIFVVVVLAIKTVLMSSVHSLRGDQQQNTHGLKLLFFIVYIYLI